MLLRNYIKEYKTNRAFSVAEMLLVLLIISFLIMAMPPLIHKKYVKRVIRGQHGRYECWRGVDGHLYEYIATEKDGMISGHSAGRPDAPLGIDLTNAGQNHCSFNAKDYASNASYFMFQIVGGGAGGSYPLYKDGDSSYHGETSVYAEGDVFLQNDFQSPGDNANAHGNLAEAFIYLLTDWKWSYKRFIEEGLLNGDSPYYSANMEWVKDYFPPVYNINKVELCSPQGTSGIPHPVYWNEEIKTVPTLGQFAGPGYCVTIDQGKMMVPWDGAFNIKSTSPSDYAIPVIEEYRKINVTDSGDCETETCSKSEVHALWSDGCSASGDTINCEANNTRSLIEQYKLGLIPEPWEDTNHTGYVNDGYWIQNETEAASQGKPYYRKNYISLLSNDGTTSSEEFPRVRFYEACDDQNPYCKKHGGFAEIIGNLNADFILNPANNFGGFSYDGIGIGAGSYGMFSDIEVSEFYIPVLSTVNPHLILNNPTPFILKHGKNGAHRVDQDAAPFIAAVTDSPVLPSTIDPAEIDKFTAAGFSTSTYSGSDPESGSPSVTYKLPAPFKMSTGSQIVKDYSKYLNHSYVHYGRRVLPPQSYLYNAEIISQAKGLTIPSDANNWSGTKAIFPPRIHMKWEASYDTPTMAYAGKPGETISMMLPKLDKPMKFEIEFSATKNGNTGSYSIDVGETGERTRTGVNGGDTKVYECPNSLNAAGDCTAGWNNIMTAKGGNGIRGSVKGSKVFLRGNKTCYPSNDVNDEHQRTKVDGCLDGSFADKSTRFSTESGFYIVDELDANSPTPSALSYYYNTTLHNAHPELLGTITPGAGGFGGYTYITSTQSTQRRSAKGHNNFTYNSLKAMHADDEHFMDEWDATTGYNEELGHYISKSTENSINETYYCTIQRGTQNADKLETDTLDDGNTYHRRYPNTSPTHTVGLCSPGVGTPGAVVILW